MADSAFAEAYLHITAHKAEFVKSMEDIGEVAKQHLEKLADFIKELNPLGSLVSGLSMIGIYDAMKDMGKEAIALDFEITKMSTKFARAGTTAEEAKKQIEKMIDQIADRGVHTAMEGAAAFDEFAKKGKNLHAVMQLMPSAETLAIAGNVKLTESVELLTLVMDQFHVPLEKIPGTLDQLTAAAARTGGMGELSSALGTLGTFAATMHIPLSDVLAMLAKMNSLGTSASQGASSLYMAMWRLSNGSKALKTELHSMGLSLKDFTDKAGNIDMMKMFAAMDKAGMKGEDVMKIFGRQGRNLVKLFQGTDEAGRKGMDSVRALADAFSNNLGGAAAKAALMLETPQMKLQKFSNSIIKLKEDIGKYFMGAMADIAVGATNAVKWISKWNEENDNLIAKIMKASLVTTVLVAGVYSAIAAFRIFQLLAGGFTVANVALLAITAAVGAAVFAWEMWGEKIKEVAKSLDEQYGMTSKFQEVFAFIESSAISVWGVIESEAKTAWQNIIAIAEIAKSNLTDVWEGVLPSLKQFLSSISTVMIAAPKWISSNRELVATVVELGLAVGIATVAAKAFGVTSAVVQLAQLAWGSAIGISLGIATAAQFVWNAATVIGESVTGIYVSGLALLTTGFGIATAAETVMTAVTAVLNAMLTAGIGVVAALVVSLGTLAIAVGGATVVWNALKDTISNTNAAKADVKSWVSEIIDDLQLMSTNWEQAWEIIKDVSIVAIEEIKVAWKDFLASISLEMSNFGTDMVMKVSKSGHKMVQTVMYYTNPVAVAGGLGGMLGGLLGIMSGSRGPEKPPESDQEEEDRKKALAAQEASRKKEEDAKKDIKRRLAGLKYDQMEKGLEDAEDQENEDYQRMHTFKQYLGGAVPGAGLKQTGELPPAFNADTGQTGEKNKQVVELKIEKVGLDKLYDKIQEGLTKDSSGMETAKNTAKTAEILGKMHAGHMSIKGGGGHKGLKA